MLIVLTPYLFGLVFVLSFLFVLRKLRRDLRPKGFVRAMYVTLAVIVADIAIVVLWRSRPWWMPMCLSLIAIGFCLAYALPVLRRHPDALFSEATINRWRQVRARMSRPTRKGN